MEIFALGGFKNIDLAGQHSTICVRFWLVGESTRIKGHYDKLLNTE